MSAEPVVAVYLAWAPLGAGTVQRFAESYRAHAAGVDHRLVVVFNGYEGDRRSRLNSARAAFEGIAHEEVVLAEPILDLAAYRVAAGRLGTSRCCFLNSYSTILGPNWLAHLNRALDLPGAGLVGASGSWASHRSYARYVLRLGGPYAGVFSDRRAALRALVASQQHEAPDRQPRPAVSRHLEAVRTLPEWFRGFGPFPVRHIRTTGFMVAADMLVSILNAPLRTKMDTYRVESGLASLSAQVEAAGLRLFVVGRDARHFGSEEWAESRTFWRADQENLLVADRQTMGFTRSDDAQRRVLSGLAWGLPTGGLEPATRADGAPGAA